jgi:hypothetical protein
MPPSFRAPPARPHPLTPLVFGLALVKVLLPFLISREWGFHRDELLYLAMGDHLDLLRMQFPPLIAVVAALLHGVSGAALPATRLAAALPGASYLVVAALVARDLGGGRGAQLFAALGVLVAPVFLRAGILFQPVVYEQLWWLVACWALVRMLRDDGPRWWMVLGLALGLGALTKFSVAFLAVGVLAAVLVSALRADLKTAWPWLALLLAVLVGLPSIMGQVAWQWPFLEQARVLRTTQLARVSPLDFISGQFLMLGAAAPLALLGLAALLTRRVPDGWRIREPWRALGVLFLTTATLFLLLGGKPYYLAPLHGMLVAAGAVRLEGWFALGSSSRAAFVTVLTALGGLVLLPVGVPVLAPDVMAAYGRAIGISKATETNRGTQLELPQDYADMLGWEEQVAAVARVYRALPASEQAQVTIVAGNYGRAGALQLYAPKYGLPTPVSRSGDFYNWGPGDRSGDVLIIVGGDHAELGQLFRSVTLAETVSNPRGVEEEREVRIHVVRDPVKPLHELWRELGPDWG